MFLIFEPTSQAAFGSGGPLRMFKRMRLLSEPRAGVWGAASGAMKLGVERHGKEMRDRWRRSRSFQANAMLAFTQGSLYDLKRCDEFPRLIVESMASGFDALDHPSFVVFGKGAQNLVKLVTIFLLRLHGDLYLHSCLPLKNPEPWT
jgi:hypothetical protein